MFLLFILAGFAAMFLVHTAPFPFLLDGLASSRSLWRMPSDEGPIIYLTFDDGPNPTATPALLDVLAEHGAQATFFVIDKHISEATAPILRRMFVEGHSVGLHSDTRGHMMMSPAQFAATLTEAADRIEHLAGQRPCRAYRPHAGWRSSYMYEGLRQINHSLVGWGWMLWDWNWFRSPSSDSVVDRVVRRASAGDIVVIHDGHHVDPEADRRYAVEAVAKLLPALRDRGFTFGTIC